MRPQLQAWFAEYNRCHTHPTNRLTHKFAIPVIVFHIIAMLDWVTLPVTLIELSSGPYLLSLGHVLAVGALGFYAWAEWRYALIMAAIVAPMIALAHITPVPVVIALAVVGWLIQLAGHVVWEKAQPAFLTNLLQALIGPIYFVAVLVGDWDPGADTSNEFVTA
jgi:uncharacterized membrane protein YGL010W